MSTTLAPARSSITDSPWYWVYLFCTAGLVALVLVGPKYASRQSQIERNAQRRQRAIQQLSGQQPTTPLSDSEHMHIGLRPLYYVLGTLLVMAWANLGWRYYGRRRTPMTACRTVAPATEAALIATPAGATPPGVTLPTADQPSSRLVT